MLLPAGKSAEYEWVKLRTKHINIDDSLISSASSFGQRLFDKIPVFVLLIVVVSTVAR